LTESELGTLVLGWIAREQQLDPAQLSTSQQLTEFALDSLATISLIEFLEQQLETSLSGTALTGFRTIDELTHHLVGGPEHPN
jgi:acyl carrier protein